MLENWGDLSSFLGGHYLGLGGRCVKVSIGKCS